MAAPTLYALAYDFTAFQTASPTTPLPADKIEIEFNAIGTTTSEIITNLGLIQRSDGALANGIVTVDSLSSTVTALLGSDINPEGAWLTTTSYDVLDLVDNGGSTYLCAVAHTSGTFATDLAANKWLLWASNGSGITVNDSNWSGTDLAVANGGTGASTASGARTNLGLAIGTDVQAYDADLAAIAALAKTDGNFVVGDGTTWVVESGATARASLGLVIGTDVQAYDATLTAFASLLTAANKIPYATGVNTAGELDFKDEDNMASDSATSVPSQQSVKAYVDQRVGKVLLATYTTASSQATIDITSVMSSTYDEYELELSQIQCATDGSKLLMRTSSDNGGVFDSTAGNYLWSYTAVGTAIAGDNVSNSDTEIELTQTSSNAAGRTISGTIKMYGVNTTSSRKNMTLSLTFSQTTGNIGIYVGGAIRNDTTNAINAARLYWSSGNFANGGVVRVYGLSKS